MGEYQPTDNDLSTQEWLGDPGAPRQMTAASGPPPYPRPARPASAPVPEQAYADSVTGDENSQASEARQRERYGGLNWGAGFYGFVVAAGLVIAMSGVVAAGVLAMGLTDAVLPSGPAGGPRAAAIATAAILLTVLLLGCYAGGYVAGRMSRFDGGRQGLAVWLTGLLVGGIGVCLGLLARSSLAGLQHLSLPTASAPPETVFGTLVIGGAAVLLASLLVMIVGGRVGCRYHGKVDEAAYR